MRSFVFLAFLSSVKVCSCTQFVEDQRQPAAASNSTHSESLSSNYDDDYGYHYGNHHDHHHDHNRYHQHIPDPDFMTSHHQNIPNTHRKPSEDVNEPRHYNIDSKMGVQFNKSPSSNFRRDTFNSSLKRIEKDNGSMVYSANEAAASMESQKRVKAPSFSSRNCTFGLCDEVDDYPAEKIARIISRSREFKQYFEEMAENKIDINNRFGEEGDTMCSTMTHTKFPQSARNTNNVQMLLVNVGDYKQGIFYETCLGDGGACMYSEIFPDGYTTICKQKYTVRRLMAVLKESDKAIFDNFELPSCCVCMIKKP